ncbi:Sec1-like protein [Tilletiaria anomala UBC 951]|uniref:Sec1-like protein n=1 Tax=Tilletiaria anomala (strain ATCC 24038 / CBS 436.72 / UBC 951) TaxID=1037660 RepID=A0A066W5Y6_TILAU|nr:Sec1-like protein [Tilletiaria anomala UBC 951]KDN47943.1 Sec1-like protein [Tilletiaria anomala UBC 951]
MDVTKAISAYIERMITDVNGMKVLLLDAETTPIISTAFTQSSLLSHEVYLTDRVDNVSRDRMRHLKCVALLRPTPSSVDFLVRELREPKYGGYWIYFTNVLKKSSIELLAEADSHEVVKEIQEFFCDYIPITPSHFSLNIDCPPHSLWSRDAFRTAAASGAASSIANGGGSNTGFLHEWEPESLERHTHGLMALLLSLKRRPVVRYERMSGLARRLGEELVYQMNQAQQSLFDMRRTEVPPLLLILDRRNDPVTPLLSQWTYQAMVHEVIGIRNGRVSLENAPGIRSDLREIVLSVDQDPFFSANVYDNFGDLGASIKKYVLDYQARTSSNSKIETVADMKKFVEEFPEFRKLGGNVSKHVALLGELSRRVEEERMLEVSELEQSLASQESHTTDLQNVQRMIESPDIQQEAKVRLAILYALRYQRNSYNQIGNVVKQLLHIGVPESRAALVNVMLNIAGAEQRQDDLFANEGLFSRGKSALKGLKGVENVYTQHSPHLAETIENLMKGRLRDTSYPFVGQAPAPLLQRYQDVIIFIIGGSTYEEARSIALINAQGPSGPGMGARFLLGGTSVHNSQTFLDMVQDAASRFPASVTRRPTTAPGAGTGARGLSVGPVSHNAAGSAGGASAAGPAALLDSEILGEAADGAKNLARGLFDTVRRGVEGIALQ